MINYSNDKFQIFLKSRPVQVFLTIEKLDNPLRKDLVMETGVQSHHMNDILKRLEDEDLIIRDRESTKGSGTAHRLTGDGELLARKLQDMIKYFEKVES